jgi:hypothetical protein
MPVLAPEQAVESVVLTADPSVEPVQDRGDQVGDLFWVLPDEADKRVVAGVEAAPPMQ